MSDDATKSRVDERPQKLFGKDFTLVCVASLTLFGGFYFLLPTLPLYVKSLGGQDAEVGAVLGVFTVSAVVTRLLVGQALDVWGRKRFYVTGALLYVLAVLLYETTTSVPSLLLLRLFHGIGWGVATTAASTLAADLAPLRRRAEAMGYYGNFINVAMALAPSVGLWLLAATALPLQGFSLVFASTGALGALAALVALLVGETRGRGRPDASPPRKLGIGGLFNRDAVPVSTAMFLMTFTYGAAVTFLPLYVATENTQNVGVFYFVYAAVVVVSRPFAGVLADRMGRRKVATPAMALSALGISILALSPSLQMVLASALIYGLGFGALYPSLLALAVDVVKPAERGAALGTFMAAFDSGIAVGSMALGLVAQMAGYSSVFVLAGCVGVVGLAYFLAYPCFSDRSRAESAP